MYAYAISSMTRYGAHWATLRISPFRLTDNEIQDMGRREPPTWSFIPNGPFRADDVVSVVHEERELS